MKNKNMLMSILIFVIATLIYTLFYTHLPNEIPIHFNSNGEADGYAPKLFFYAVIAFLFVLHIFVNFMLKKDPKNKNMPSIMIRLTLFTIPILTLLITFVTIAYVYALPFHTTSVIKLFTGILFLCIGNYLPKVKQNYTMGIKTPWTLNDEVVWNKTHRLGGVLFVILGIITIASAFLFNIFLFLGLVIIAVLIPFIYSYLLYQKRHNEKERQVR